MYICGVVLTKLLNKMSACAAKSQHRVACTMKHWFLLFVVLVVFSVPFRAHTTNAICCK